MRFRPCISCFCGAGSWKTIAIGEAKESPFYGDSTTRVGTLCHYAHFPNPTTNYGPLSTPDNTLRHIYDNDETQRPFTNIQSHARQLDIPHHFHHNLMHHSSAFQYPLTTQPSPYDKLTKAPDSKYAARLPRAQTQRVPSRHDTTDSQNRDTKTPRNSRLLPQNP